MASSQPPLPQRCTRNSSSKKKGATHMGCIEYLRRQSKCERPTTNPETFRACTRRGTECVMPDTRPAREKVCCVRCTQKKQDAWCRNLIQPPATSVLRTTSGVRFFSQNHHADPHLPQPEISAYTPTAKRLVRCVFLSNSQPVCLVCVLRLTQQAQRSSIKRSRRARRPGSGQDGSR